MYFPALKGETETETLRSMVPLTCVSLPAVPSSEMGWASWKANRFPRCLFFFFFFPQQFITRHAMADRGSYFVTTYKRGKLT